MIMKDKNKKFLRIFSTSFLLGTLLVTSPTFAESASNNHRTSTYGSGRNDASVGTSASSGNIEQNYTKIPNKFKSELRLSLTDFDTYPFFEWLVNNYVLANDYQDHKNHYVEACGGDDYHFSNDMTDMEKLVYFRLDFIKVGDTSADPENLLLGKNNHGNTMMAMYKKTADGSDLGAQKYSKDKVIELYKKDSTDSLAKLMGTGYRFIISDYFTTPCINTLEKYVYMNKATFNRDFTYIRENVVKEFKQKFGTRYERVFGIESDDPHNNETEKRLTLPSNFPDELTTLSGGFHLRATYKSNPNGNGDIHTLVSMYSKSYLDESNPYNKNGILVGENEYKGDASLPFKQVKKSHKKQLVTYEEKVGDKIKDSKSLTEYKAMMRPIFDPNGISTEANYNYVGNVEKTTKVIPYKTIKQNDPTLKAGQTKIKTKGVNGKSEKVTTYKVNSLTGELSNPTTKSNDVKPIDEVILVGTMTAETKEETKTETVKFEKETRNNPKLEKGQTKVIQKGVNGIKEIKYKVTYEAGKEIKREKISEKITKQPIKEIIEVGTLDKSEKSETKTEVIKFEKETKENPKLEKGQTRVIQKGIDGEKTYVYKIYLENGKEVKREKVSETITKKPVKEIIEVGTLVREEKEDIKTEPVKFETEHKENPKLEKGQSKVVQKGIDGEKTLKYKVIYENGKEVKRELVEEKVTKKPVKEIIEVGTLVKEIKEDTKVEEIKFDTEHKENPQLKKGHSRIAQKGVKGEKTYKYKVIYENGKEVKRELIEEKVTKKPVKEIIEIGTLDRQVRCEKKIEIIKHECKHIESKDLEKGHSRIAQKGQDGEKTYVYEVIYENGKEKSRKLVGEKITKEAKDEIIEIGIKDVEKEPEKPTSPSKPSLPNEQKPEEKPEEIDSAELEKSFTKDDKKPEEKPEEIDSAELEKSFTKDEKKPEQKPEEKPTTRQESSQGKKPSDNNYQQIEQAKKPEPQQNKTPEKMPKAGIENEISLLAAGALSTIAGLATLKKKRR